MQTITPLRRRTAADSTTGSPHPHAVPTQGSNRDHGPAGYPHPSVPKIRGPKLVALWVGLAAGAWGVVGGAGYGLYSIAQTLLR